MTASHRPTVVFVLPDARRVGYQLRMNLGGTYLGQVRQAVAILDEAHDGGVPDLPTLRSRDPGEPCHPARGDDASGRGPARPGKARRTS